MNQIQLYWKNFIETNFLETQNIRDSFGTFILDILLVALLCHLLSLIYIKYAKTLSNRSRFSQNFIYLGLTTMMVITIIQSSLTLSLGLVGALSIVRFRAAIKEPEELVYLFLSIAIGLGLGANQRYITLVFFIIMALVIWLKHLFEKSTSYDGMFLSIKSDEKPNIEIKQLETILKKYATFAKLKRIDQNEEYFDSLFLVNLKNLTDYQKLANEIKQLDGKIYISLLDTENLVF